MMGLRAVLSRRAVLKATRLPLPAVAVGNLSVGGTGKTPLAAWIARRYAGRGRVPGILLRGYGGGAPAGAPPAPPDPGGAGGAAPARAGALGPGGGRRARGDGVRYPAGAAPAGRPPRPGRRGDRGSGELRGAARSRRRRRASPSVSRPSPLRRGRRRPPGAGLRRGGLCCSH